jgi:hypothetical protein
VRRDNKEEPQAEEIQTSEPAPPPASKKPEFKEAEEPKEPEPGPEKPAQTQQQPPQDKPAEAPKEDAQMSMDTFVMTNESKPSEDPPKEESKSTETQPEPNKEEASEMPKQTETQPERAPPAAPPNTQVEPQQQETQNPTEPLSNENEKPSAPPQQDEPKRTDENTKTDEPKPTTDTSKADAPSADTNSATQPNDDSKPTESAPATNGSAIEPEARTDDVPSSILEKGIIYFFFRARVNISDPQDVTDIARSYFILRPLPHGAALGDGAIPDSHNARLIALPKKVFPLSGKDKFMVFVEKSGSSFKELRDGFMSASDYPTKTRGTSHSPPVTPVAEGVYAITTTGRESHLAYITTIPDTLGEVQKDIGLRDSGSFVVSAKNPKYPGPANASLSTPPEYPDDIMEEFRDLRWMPLQPKLLDYVNTQFLLIGESVEKATEGLPRDEKQGKDGVLEEMERLEGEDEVRVRHLKGKSIPCSKSMGSVGVESRRVGANVV